MGLARASPRASLASGWSPSWTLLHEFTPVQVIVPPSPRLAVAIRLVRNRAVSIQCDAIAGHMAKIETILVVGGGIAGLTAATALHQHGFRTELVERQQTWHALGTGFLVHANGMRMLLALGLA